VLAWTTLRNIVGTLRIAEANVSQEEINASVKEQLTLQSETWGIGMCGVVARTRETKNERNKRVIIASDRLKGRLPEHCLCAIRAHDYRSAEASRSKLDKALVAVDSATFLVDGTGLRREELSIEMIQRKPYASIV
jgi:predicted hydrolase (HD superfamily)